MPPLAQALAPLADTATRQRHHQSCGGKVPHFTQADALAVLAHWPVQDRQTLDVYACTWCGWYHLGNYAGGVECHNEGLVHVPAHERTNDGRPDL